jgi:nucleotide-binding universal stress UspA family protein/predicted transcriptional regulator
MSRSSTFDRVVCGIDGSVEGLEAARQAARLAEESLTLVAAVDPWDLVMSGGSTAERGRLPSEPGGADRLRADAASALEAARGAIETSCAIESKLIEDRPADSLLREAERVEATMIAVGTHGRGRLVGIALGSVATAVVHRAPCSVLVARPLETGAEFPGSVVVGVDGSPESARACLAARELRERFGATTRFVLSVPGGDLDAAQAIAAPDEIVAIPEGPVPALLGAARDADVLVVGSRGLRGLRALGSVSERVVHAAPCSVLVVRPAASHPKDRSREPMLVRDLMSTPVVVAAEETRLDEIARMMLEHEIGAVPIVSDDRKLVGIISESDFAGREIVFATSRYGHQIRLPKVLGELMFVGDALEGIYEASQRLRARSVMSAPVHVASEDEPVQQALTRMLHHEIDHMPVVRGGVPVGMLARYDLLRLAFRTWEDRSGD